MQTVGIVIPAYNAAAYIGEAIESVLSQTPPPDQLVVVDDGSTDDTARVVAAYGNRLELHRQENRGPSAARNLGCAHLRTDVVAFLDSDDLLLPGGLAKRLSLLGDRNAAWGYTEGHLSDESGRRWLFSHTYPPAEGNCREVFSVLLCRNFITASAMIVRRDILTWVGGFDTAICGTEDWDFALRLAVRYPARYGPEPTFLQRRVKGSLATNREAMDGMRYTMLVKISQLFPREVAAASRSARRSVADAHNGFGYALARHGRCAEARRHLWKSVKLSPGQGRAWLLLTRSLLGGLSREL